MQRGRMEKQSKGVALKALEYLKAKKGITTNTDIAIQVICNFMIDYLEGSYNKEAKLEELESLKAKLDPEPFPEDKPYKIALYGIDEAIRLVNEYTAPEVTVNILQSIQGFRV